jgi:uncharacterized protein involved in exopolysaccharide biosynthesis
MREPPYAPDDDGRELERMASLLRRALHAWPLTLLVLSLAAFACCAFLYFRHPGYRSETVILYSAGVRQTDATEQDDNPRSASVRLKELLMSRPKLAQVVTRFGLYPDTRARYGVSDAVDELKRHIEFKAPGGDTFSIAFTGTSPSEAQKVTRALAELVVAGDAELRKTQAEQARDFLTTERANKGTELRDAEQRLAEFMDKHRRFALDTTPLAAGAAIRASMAPAAHAPQPVYVSRAPRRESTPASGGTPSPAPAASASAEAAERARAVAALAAARANLAEQLEHYTPAHPDVRAAQAEVDRATARVAALGEEAKPAPAQVAAAAPAAHAAPANPAHHVAMAVLPPPRPGERDEDVVGLETEWLKLTRDVTAARQRVDQVDAALFKADVLASSERAGRAVQISVIDPAFLPERPIGLGLNLVIAIFLGVGLVLGLFAALLAAAFDDRIYRASDARDTTAILVEVPRFSSRRRAYAAQ